ncbi:MAG: hypothetical protein J0M17_01475 [Planctomycetes bacterium]|nr:hypothetical protein [Planctomycetota bacterium]
MSNFHGHNTHRQPRTSGRVNPARTARVGGDRRMAPRARSRGQTNVLRVFMPPETWHEPRENASGYKFVVESAGPGYRHVVTPDEVRARLALLPPSFTAGLQVVQLGRMTRKKRSMPLYGMQWGSAIYLYPIEESLVEHYNHPPTPAQRTEAKMYGGRWEDAGGGKWRLVWTLEAVKDFYLNNILLHELGHLLDTRNTRTIDRERYAEWFAVEYGYRPTQRERQARRIASLSTSEGRSA